MTGEPQTEAGLLVGRQYIDLASYDAQIIGNQERCIAHWKHEADRHEQELTDLFNVVVYLLNPPDSDSWHPLDAIRAAAAFIEAQPCTCPPEAGPPDYVEDPCERCRILGRIHDQPQTR